VLAVVGGAKISTKLDLLSNLISRVEFLVIGGAMANTFLAAEGYGVGKSLCEHDLTGTARDIRAAAAEAGCDIILPLDVTVAKDFRADTEWRTAEPEQVRVDEMILDIGPLSINRFEALLADVRTVVWNGPLGAFELEPFAKGTVRAARAVAEATRAGRVISVAGGGDTVAALNRAGVSEDFTYVSTAGGAFLEWLEGRELPGVAALRRE
ncbi:MAG: phosphoglycerate kinase, partial [Alphaproteobacteria bacterium]